MADPHGQPLGWAWWSPTSEIALRRVERDSGAAIDRSWWRARLAHAIARRAPLATLTNARRLVHGEGDGLPALVVDQYDRWLVVQLLSAALEAQRAVIVDVLSELVSPAGILARNDASVRAREGLPREVELLTGAVPEEIEVNEHGVKYLAAPWTGQKTGAFLDQRENRLRAGRLTRPGGRALDCFAYHGSFAIHMAAQAGEVIALDVSDDALQRGSENAALNAYTNITWRLGDAFDVLKEMDRARERFDIIVVDPPAFAKSRDAVVGALRGYNEVNRRAMRLLAPGGVLVTASCSFHVHRPDFEAMLAGAAADSQRRMVVLEHLGQGADHPEVLTIPETAYLKGMVLQAAR
jgi:23S rRNA (cytosine1962-C5)-methyltransferase